MNKEQQKELLKEIMEADAKDGLYHIGNTNKMVTAVEYLFIQLYEKFEMKGDGKEMNAILEQAKAMEKEQITKAWDDGDYAYFHSKETGRDFDNGEQYYNETYNK
jgi:DNA-binding TFAR19-related protein (PDSD5 family)